MTIPSNLCAICRLQRRNLSRILLCRQPCWQPILGLGVRPAGA